MAVRKSLDDLNPPETVAPDNVPEKEVPIMAPEPEPTSFVEVPFNQNHSDELAGR